MADKLIKIVEDYFAKLREKHRLDRRTDERSCCTAVANLRTLFQQEGSNVQQ